MKPNHEPWRPGKPVLAPSEMSTIAREALKEVNKPLPDYITYTEWIRIAIRNTDFIITHMKGDL